ncbi:cell division protein ZapA [Siccirubricoccus phaeus]|uniref:cell division protein ZapA n=1 Tax=Siccirubricoccus phaeus TaxID=2595053 RepID=UPI0011F3E680|nr:cell division protein ZapA [Siccirubricoccus phaeus]
MGQVTVRVNGYQHTIGCKDGEEPHVTGLIAQIEDKVRLIRAMGGQFSEARMLLHVALLLADELHDLRAVGGIPTAPVAAPDPLLAERLGRIAERIEGLARTLDPQAPDPQTLDPQTLDRG